MSAPIPTGKSDSWFTPLELFRPWHRELNFTLDPSGHDEAPVSQLIGHWWTVEDDGLNQSWTGQRVFCNPPYSDIEPWAHKAFAEVHGGDCPLVVMLVPANRTEQPWWQSVVEPYRDRKLDLGTFSVTTRFLARRFKFGFPGDPEGLTSGSPTFGCVVVAWRRP